MRGQVLLTKSSKSVWEKEEREKEQTEREKERVLEREAL